MANKKPTYRKYSLSDFENAIKDCKGNKTTVIRRIGCSRATFYTYLKRYPQLAEMINFESSSHKEVLEDLACSNLIRALENGEWWATRYVLDRCGFGRDHSY